MLIDSDPDNVDKGEIDNLANSFVEMKIETQTFRTLMQVLTNTLKLDDYVYPSAKAALLGMQILV